MLASRILQNIEELTDEAPGEIIWAYKEYQPLYDELRYELPNFRLHEGEPTQESMNAGDKRPRLWVLDDMGLGGEQGAAVFTRGCHHWNCSCICLVQNLYQDRKRTSRINAKYVCLMRNPGDQEQVRTLARQLFPGNSHYLLESYADATKDPYSYLLIDNSQQCDPHFRLFSCITPEEGAQVWYKKK